ncbi:MAG: glycyl aminopeptidase [Acidobacteriales bacterium]|nr:glycyl aminopeptidase [Terriglobales bacterium]
MIHGRWYSYLHSLSYAGGILKTHVKRFLLLVVFTLTLTLVANSQDKRGPNPVPYPPAIAAPVDVPYPGTISLLVDLTDNTHRVANVHETVPVSAGELTLLYPKWIPGNHSPTGPISKVAGLVVTAGGKRIPWLRDPVNVYAFHITVPTGVKSVDVEFQYLSPVTGREGRIEISNEIADLAWDTVLLYPAGYFVRNIQVEASLKLPEGWKFASALDVNSQAGSLVHFKTTTLNTLVDSPVYAGIHYKRVDLSTDAQNKVFLDVFGDKEADLAISPEELTFHRNMVKEAAKLYASRHYDHYDFLFSVSDKIGGMGLEHHQSSEDGERANYFTDWAAGVRSRDLLAHEYTHSWDGKFRRPADIWTPNYDVPMRDSLLWVYEGMTEYYGFVLTARSGMRTAAQTRDLIGEIAANFDISPGRKWRPMEDTTNQPTVSQRTPVSWVSWQRPEDYYTEGLLIWLDADTKIREMSGGKKSLDDFAKIFYGIDNGSYVTRTYTFDDVVAALNQVQPFDWATFLHKRVDELAPETPKDGITRGGYRLAYSDTPPDWLKAVEQAEAAESEDGEPSKATTNFSTSLGFTAKSDGSLGNVWWDSPAFKAGMAPDMQIVGQNGTAFSTTAIKQAIVAAESSKEPIHLLVKRGREIKTIDIDYHGGLRYPKLERVEGTPARLDEILAPGK